MATVYSSLKLFKFQDHLKALAEKRVLAPVHIRIKPTNACNHRCWFCAYRADNLELGQDMSSRDSIPRKKMLEIVDDIVAMGVKAVTFSGGGEPLIYRHIVETVNRLGRGGVKVAALTNGAFLKGPVADAFARYGTWVRVSLDGWDDASLSRFRGVRAGEFGRIVSNMRAFARRRSKCVLGVCLIVSKENCGRILEFCRLMKRVGVDHVKLSGCVVSTDGRKNNRYHAPIKAKVRRQIEAAKKLVTSKFQILDHYHDLSERFDKSYTLCPYLQFLTVIGADCRVYTCQDKAYTKRGLLGSIEKRSFRKFWFSRENRKRLFAVDPSKSCDHHCVTHAKNLLIHDFLNVDWDHGDFV